MLRVMGLICTQYLPTVQLHNPACSHLNHVSIKQTVLYWDTRVSVLGVALSHHLTYSVIQIILKHGEISAVQCRPAWI